LPQIIPHRKRVKQIKVENIAAELLGFDYGFSIERRKKKVGEKKNH